MNLAVAFLLLAAVQAADVKGTSRSKNVEDEVKTNKRALLEGNAVEKRAPILPTALPSVTPGIEYAASKELQSDKSPAQQIYATPVPQIAKISDVLTGQGPAFQAAIASHLYSPVPVYQARLSSPTTYEVSPPVPSQLAYTGKLSYQPNVQYTAQVYQKPQKQALPVQQQQLLVQPLYQQQAQLNPQQIYQHVPQIYQAQLYQNQIPLYPQGFQVAYPQGQIYSQQLVQAPGNIQPGIVYRREESSGVQNQQQTSPKDLKTVQPVTSEKPTPYSQNYNAQSQGAVSYASFSQSQPSPSYAEPQYQRQAQQTKNQPQPQEQYQTQDQPQYQSQNQPQYQRQSQQAKNQPQPQEQYQTQDQPQYQSQNQPQYHLQSQQYQTQNQPQYQPQPQLKQTQSQPQTLNQPKFLALSQLEYRQPHQFQSEPRIQYQPQYQYQFQPHYQSQPQYQIQPQFQSQPQYAKLEPSPSNSVVVPVKSPVNQVPYFRPGPVQLQADLGHSQLFRPQVYSGQGVLVQNSGFEAPSLAVSPTFPPVQYFGKFAQAIFGGYQQ